MTHQKALRLIYILLAFMVFGIAQAQDIPTVSPTMDVIAVDDTAQDVSSFDGSAPAEITFKANADNVGGWTATYEWRFYKNGEMETPYLTRYEEQTSFTFTEAGTFRVQLIATFVSGTDSIVYTSEDLEPLAITISESALKMPNAFSPNGDGINDIYKPKTGWKSIVEFHGYIFNRWGKKLYEWTQPDMGWDGKYNGRDVPDGVYFCLVKAKGADGKRYSIKRDVNLLRGYTEGSTTTE